MSATSAQHYSQRTTQLLSHAATLGVSVPRTEGAFSSVLSSWAVDATSAVGGQRLRASDLRTLPSPTHSPGYSVAQARSLRATREASQRELERGATVALARSRLLRSRSRSPTRTTVGYGSLLSHQRTRTLSPVRGAHPAGSGLTAPLPAAAFRYSSASSPSRRSPAPALPPRPSSTLPPSPDRVVDSLTRIISEQRHIISQQEQELVALRRLVREHGISVIPTVIAGTDRPANSIVDLPVDDLVDELAPVPIVAPVAITIGTAPSIDAAFASIPVHDDGYISPATLQTVLVNALGYRAGDAEVEADELTADGLTRTDLQDMLACVFEDDFAKLTALASIDWAAAAADRAAAKTDIEIHLVTADGTVLEGESVMNRPPPPAVPPPPLDDTHLHL
ncbi:uncharacterized protein AMSG_03961 [Thecamonas trahens ATCC 50062]|uniref:Uncharacterized protein n=1 Tax=Thecamonas trahens ATCC 50062 TaxID=461836 RepID=A0A0L0D5V3_THETB|nr:hypothetical protein AMSG_03961 [Thecamonas trahens ATCC 50062]KNC47734.1 hypothetical protein AMSG_03961 [Thecamonas trahens ATCC 50062]|eukprot:XP_013759212.1 hypothetical protein AMSG_03961 [Thecamonas trahens ATCC 50062]